ncbi:PilZ domain-containing protein [bacterium]|nr:PilZ domain-containing protein [bacterium]
MARKIRTVPIQPVAPYGTGAHYMVIPADLKGDFSVCKAVVERLEDNGAWLCLRPESAAFPSVEEVLLVDFQSASVMTHQTRILKREPARVWVDCPSLSRRSRSQLLPTGGRRDFRVAAELPVVILLKGEQFAQALPRSGRLNDLSRGGMGVSVPIEDIYARGQRIEIQVVSWAYAVSVETTVERVWVEGEKKLLALKFPEDLTPEQRERISSFILHVQRKASLESSLPATIEDSI